MDYYTYIGVVLKFKNNTNFTKVENVGGCKKCKTQSHSKFCDRCGQKTSTYEVKKTVNLKNSYALSDYIDGKIEDVEFSSYFTGLEYANDILLVNFRGKKRPYQVTDFDFDGDFYSVDDKDIIVSDFKEEAKDILEKIKNIGLEFEVVYGVVPYAC